MAAKARFDPAQYAANWELQLGSLGSGNHFIEVCADETDAVWLFLHSGSRGVGNKSRNGTSPRPGARSGAGTSSCRIRTWPTSRKAPPNSTATSGNSAGPSTSPC